MFLQIFHQENLEAKTLICIDSNNILSCRIMKNNNLPHSGCVAIRCSPAIFAFSQKNKIYFRFSISSGIAGWKILISHWPVAVFMFKQSRFSEGLIALTKSSSTKPVLPEFETVSCSKSTVCEWKTGFGKTVLPERKTSLTFSMNILTVSKVMCDSQGLCLSAQNED